MLILGIDPGTATTGYGVLKVKKKRYDAVGWGLIETDKNSEAGERYINIFKEMSKVIKSYSPDIVAIEKVFFASNVKTAISVGQAQGVMLYCAARAKLEIVEYAPGTIKKVVSGSGRADKKEMQKALRKVLGNKVRSPKKKRTHFDNAADGLAIALCHAMVVNDKKE
ncbi:crossover junction endodeoxyribonuclease RuvC [Patescibacteria group bacterium]